jgi:hypothetical protein
MRQYISQPRDVAWQKQAEMDDSENRPVQRENDRYVSLTSTFKNGSDSFHLDDIPFA